MDFLIEFCNCQSFGLDSTTNGQFLTCAKCKKPIQCEFGLELPHPATHWYRDYDVVCDEHEKDATKFDID